MDWHGLSEKVTPYILSVATPGGSGTGFLFAYNATKSIAASSTAAHVVEHAHDWKQPLKLVHHDSQRELFLSEDRRVIFLDRQRDSASILVQSKGLPLPEHVLPLLPADKVLKIGVDVGWAGFPSIASPQLCFFAGRVSSYLSNDESYLIDGVAINGVSGGPVFTEGVGDSPQIVGTVSAYMANRVRGDTLPGLLRAQDLAAFYDTIEHVKSLDEARQKEQEKAQQAREEQQSGSTS